MAILVVVESPLSSLPFSSLRLVSSSLLLLLVQLLVMIVPVCVSMSNCTGTSSDGSRSLTEVCISSCCGADMHGANFGVDATAAGAALLLLVALNGVMGIINRECGDDATVDDEDVEADFCISRN